MSFYITPAYQELLDAIEEEGREVPCQSRPDIFFPDTGGNAKQAKKLCQSCPIKLQCLKYALESEEEFGIWGGLTALERKQLKRVYRKQR